MSRKSVRAAGNKVLFVADVSRKLGRTEQVLGRGKWQAPPPPKPVRLELHGAEPIFFLFRYTQTGELVSDSWHQTLDEAFRVAEDEYGLTLDDWRAGDGFN